MKKTGSTIAVIIMIAAAALCSGNAFAFDHGHDFSPFQAKYVFYFIGDGMASPQIHATEAYLASLQEDDTVPGGIKAQQLYMSTFPVQGMQMSYANNRFITGSAAAGTALACGHKTNIGVIAMDADATLPYKSLAEAAKEKGMKVGIISSVSIDHATPAVFYAHQPSRNNYEQIDFELLNKDFDYFAGGGFRVNKWNSPAYASMSNEERYQVVEDTAVANGFVYADTREEFDALNRRTRRAIAVNPYLDGSNAIPYALNRMNADGPGERYEGSISLAEFTAKGIEIMQNRRGFFMMVEGGKIDWACHANDARAAIEDTIAFDDAIKVAVDFAKKHPFETLIVVTGDHECGGMTLGFAGTAYESYYEKMAGQTVAYDDFDSIVLPSYVADHSPIPGDIDTDMWNLILTNFGLDGNGLTSETADDLTAYEISLLEDAFDKALHGISVNPSEEDDLLYGYYNPLSVTITHIQNRKAGLDWTSYSHTAVPVPVLAKGTFANLFDGYYENTDVAHKIAFAMGVSLDE
ncbi:MAG: alkaline phosphatase [Thermodesulfobacteriota bacterium]|nr:alkaline phosphatase [Thermodesulfobacteriota bacterium]